MVSISMSAPNTIVRAALRALDSDIKTTQNRIATGLKVSSYSDDPTVWNKASSLKQDIVLADGIKSDLVISKGRADVASAALKTILDRLGDIKDKQTTAVGASTETKAAMAAEMSSLVEQIKAAITSATFRGTNFLNAAGTETANIAVDNGAAVTTTFSYVDINASGTPTALNTLLTADFAADAGVGTLTTKITNAITQINTYAGKVSGFGKALTNQMDFLTTLNDIRNKAVSSMLDADLEEESAKAKALEVRQQLAYQALSIGNNAAQNILLLFR